MDRFSEIMVPIFKWEGGFVNNEYDNGGPTNMGITHEVLARWRGVAGVTVADVKSLTEAEATEIYKDRYWGRIRGKSLPAPVDLVVMDGAVNHGVPNMVRMLQDVAGVEADGRMGPVTVSAVEDQTADDDAVLDFAVKLAERRKRRYVSHEDATHFLRGWRNRLNDVMSIALNGSPVSWTFAHGAGPGTEADGAAEPDAVSSLTRPVIEDTDLQTALAAWGYYTGDIDGLFGPMSVTAMNQVLAVKAAEISGNWRAWPLSRRKLALGQLICSELGIDVGRVDGLFGPQTEYAFENFDRRKQGLPDDNWRDELEKLPPTGTVPTSTKWPTQGNVPTFFGPLGPECRSVPLKRLALPYPMKIAWDLGTEIDGFYIHKKVHDSAARVFEKVYAEYGDEKIEELGLNLFGGCKACRKIRGGTAWSMHAWSIAIDFDPARNKLSWNNTRARLAKPDAVKFWELWEAEGWVSLGRARNYDWMHVQAARL